MLKLRRMWGVVFAVLLMFGASIAGLSRILLRNDADMRRPIRSGLRIVPDEPFDTLIGRELAWQWRSGRRASLAVGEVWVRKMKKGFFRIGAFNELYLKDVALSVGSASGADDEGLTDAAAHHDWPHTNLLDVAFLENIVQNFRHPVFRYEQRRARVSGLVIAGFSFESSRAPGTEQPRCRVACDRIAFQRTHHQLVAGLSGNVRFINSLGETLHCESATARRRGGGIVIQAAGARLCKGSEVREYPSLVFSLSSPRMWSAPPCLPPKPDNANED